MNSVKEYLLLLNSRVFGLLHK